ncbi:MAG: AraC family transcriptional regulator N-terminal domain-containing protein [Vreelandella alkaliphila]|uniref:AraC family transcriptional regulator n=1 Tax=Halomonadaceae TaxID=28256 RepID=UPI000E9AC6C2|nr:MULTISPECIES: AraC family transcriptional regulator [unclassified Halomonas]UTD55784.1 AraC family transcriptional regulator [Halomonas sp. MS1]HBP40872.1 AraC family transcriptional regulator [Halomonas sp.]HBS84428.1 AraC family transcriptional regulator [Halomonas campaniensis]
MVANTELVGNALADLISPLVTRDGLSVSRLPRVGLLCLGRRQERTPLMYEPSLIIIAQGRKIGYLGDREIHYNPGHYLVQTLPLPFECETHGSPEAPLLGISVKLDPALLSEMVTAMGDMSHSHLAPKPMASVAMNDGMQAAVLRLANALHDEVECIAMGEARIREVVFEALKGEQGRALRALVKGHGHYSRIVQVLSQLHAHFAEDFTVDQLAQQANMSISTFHQHFKQITRSSPAQYLKRLRLLKAQQLLLQDSHNVNQAAQAVGYRSVPQFSRDYKRYFGASPLQHRRQEQALRA